MFTTCESYFQPLNAIEWLKSGWSPWIPLPSPRLLLLIWLPTHSRRQNRSLQVIFKCIRLLPCHFKDYLTPCAFSYFLRNIKQTCFSPYQRQGRIMKYKDPSNWNNWVIKSLRRLKCSLFSIRNMPCSGLSCHCLLIMICYKYCSYNSNCV